VEWSAETTRDDPHGEYLKRNRWFESGSLRQPVCLTGAFRGYRHKRTGFRRECEPGRDQRTGHAGLQPAGLRLFSLTGIDAVPPLSGKPKRSMRRCQALAWTHSIEGRSLTARQQAALVGPVERQIEFGETCRGEFDRLPAVQDRVDQLGAEKGEVD
jgi:hypothetical protein